MNLIHRNRVGFSRLGRLEHPPLRSPFPSGEGFILCIRLFQVFVPGQPF